MTPAFPTLSLRRRRRAVDGAAKRSRGSSTGSGVSLHRDAFIRLASKDQKRVGPSAGNSNGRRSVNSCSKFSVVGTEEIKHECEAAQSARSGRVVCRVGNAPGNHFRRRKGAQRQRKTAGCRRAGERQKGRKEGREER